MTPHLKGHRQAHWRIAAASAPLLALAACDFGNNAAYHSGFQLGYEQKTREVERVTEILADDPPPTQGELLNGPMPAPVTLAATAPPKAKPKPAPRATLRKVSAPSPKPTPRPAALATARIEPVTQTAEAASPTPAPASAAPVRPPQTARAPFAPLRPGPGGSGFIIQVGNNPYAGTNPPPGNGNPAPSNPGNPKDPDTKPPTGDPGDDPGTGTIPAPIPVPQPGATTPQSNPGPVKITIVDTALTGKNQTSSLIGVGAISTKPVTGQLASVNVLTGDKTASVGVINDKVANISVLPSAPGKPVDSIAAISVGNTPVVSGGQAPLVSISALPDLGGVTKVISPITGAILPGASTSPSPASPTPAPTVVGGVVSTVGGVVGGLTSSLTGALTGGK